MEVRIENGKLHIIADVINPPMPSASGKTMVVASSRGNQTTTATVNGQRVTVGFNAYIKR